MTIEFERRNGDINRAGTQEHFSSATFDYFAVDVLISNFVRGDRKTILSLMIRIRTIFIGRGVKFPQGKVKVFCVATANSFCFFRFECYFIFHCSALNESSISPSSVATLSRMGTIAYVCRRSSAVPVLICQQYTASLTSSVDKQHALTVADFESRLAERQPNA
jgi:hypothetical protein